MASAPLILPDSVPAADTVSTVLFRYIAANAPEPIVIETSQSGLTPLELTPGIEVGTPLTALLMAVLVVAALNASGLHHALKSYRHQLWSVRSRHNAFDDEHSAPLPMAVLMSIIFAIFGGIVLYNIPAADAAPSFPGTIASMGLVGVFYLFQYLCYKVIAYTFASKEGAQQFVGGFMASQAFAAITMAIPAVLLVFTPQYCDILIIISLSTYCIFHCVFIVKGLRIFYTGYSSLIYFILYLCSVEIIPVLALYGFQCQLRAFIA